MIYSPGDIIVADYTNMAGASSQALFLVLYNEAIDSSVKHNSNLVVAKVTTNYDFFDTYAHSLSPKFYTFLHKVCYVRSNKPNVIITTNVKRYLGSLSDRDRYTILENFKSFTDELLRQNSINKISNTKKEMN